MGLRGKLSTMKEELERLYAKECKSTLILWDDELENENDIVERITRFVNG